MAAGSSAARGWRTPARGRSCTTTPKSGRITRRTDGPFTESVEQLGGFYIVESPDIEAVVEAAEEMMPVHVRLEIAPTSG